MCGRPLTDAGSAGLGAPPSGLGSSRYDHRRRRHTAATARDAGGDVGTYIIRRLLQMIPVILGATFLIFAMVFALPGDPLAGKCGERPCPPQYAAAFRAKYNLNDPLPVQYGKYLGNLAQGDLGETYNGIKVTDAAQACATRSPRSSPSWRSSSSRSSASSPACSTGIRRGGFLDNLVLVSTHRRDLDPRLRHRQPVAVLLRRQARPVPGHRRPRPNPRSTSCCCPPWCWARSRWPTSPA